MRGRRITGRWALGTALGALLLAGCSHEAADWKQAGLANSAEAYQAFLQHYPHSPEAVEAQTRIKQLAEQRDWQVAGSADSRDAYQQFVTQHPDSKWAQEARIRIENFAQAGVSGGAALAGAATSPAAPAPVAAASGGTTNSAVAQGTQSEQPKPESNRTGSVAPVSRHDVARHHNAAVPTRAESQVVQLGAFRTKARAESEWKLLSTRFSTLKSLKPRYVASRSKSGQIYRLQVRLSSEAAASGLCATLKKHARACVRINA